jgi:hypothetical protein
MNIFKNLFSGKRWIIYVAVGSYNIKGGKRWKRMEKRSQIGLS